ncbi:hypothetical protein [Viscerimonas tarda]
MYQEPGLLMTRAIYPAGTHTYRFEKPVQAITCLSSNTRASAEADCLSNNNMEG